MTMDIRPAPLTHESHGSVLGRRSFLALLTLPAVAAVLQACGGDDTAAVSDGSTPAGTGSTEPSSDLVQSAALRQAASVEDAAAAVTALNTFGADAYGLLAAMSAATGGNLVFSPASIAIALAMVRAGAVGITGTEIDEVLHVADPAAVHRSMNALSAALESRSGTFDLNGESREVTLSIANSMWGQSGLEFEQPFLDTLAGEYGAGMRVTDYAADPEAARSAINDWVAQETNERIPQLLGEGDVTPDTRLTLVNAVYLKAPWVEEFMPEATTDLPFTRLDGSSVEVPTMMGQRFWPYASGDGWQAIDLAYVGNQLSMLLVVPDAATPDAVEASLAGGLLDDVVEALETREVKLWLPKWDTETFAPLADLLADLGMPTAFTGQADFSGITTQEALAITSVVHQANITVDEHGTEAAAATAVLAGATAMPDPTDLVELHVDRTFLFALRDTVTGAVVFLGRVADPSGR